MSSLLLMTYIVLCFRWDRGNGKPACQPCQCCKDPLCDISTSKCLSGCMDSYWGDRCLNRCPKHCRVCSSNNDCSFCKDGYYNGYSGVNYYKNCILPCPYNCKTCTSYTECTSCRDGYYSVYNDTAYGYNLCKKCPNTCLDGECDGATGECIKGCVDKKWGMTCQEDCPTNCVKCDRSSGSCSVCEGGRYLADCSQSCSASCNTNDGKLLCVIENGACLNGCADFNIYGTHCEKICSINCKENVCSWLTGDCVKGCQENHWGKQCENVCSANCISIDGSTRCNESTGHCLKGCINGYYSVQCDKTCSITCLNASCDISGKCIHGCSGNFADDSCLQVKYNSSRKRSGYSATIAGSVGGALALTVIVIVAAIVLFKRRRGAEENKEGNGNNVVVYSNMNNRLQNSDTVTSAAEEISTAYEIIGKRDDLSNYPALSCDTNQSAALLHVGSRSSEQVATGKIQTIYEKPILEEDMREYAALEYDTSQTSDDNINKDKLQNQSLALGKGTTRKDSADNITNTGACSSDEKTIIVHEEEHAEYINTSLAFAVSHGKKYP